MVRVVTASPLYRTERLCTVNGYRAKIVPFNEGKAVDADVIVNNNYSWALKETQESSEYDYIAFHIEGGVKQ